MNFRSRFHVSTRLLLICLMCTFSFYGKEFDEDADALDSGMQIISIIKCGILSDAGCPDLQAYIYKKGGKDKVGDFSVVYRDKYGAGIFGKIVDIDIRNHDDVVIASGSIHFGNSRKSAQLSIFREMGRTPAPGFLIANDWFVIKEGPGELYAVNTVEKNNKSTGGQATSAVLLIRSSVGIRLRAKDAEFRLQPLAKELDAMIVAAMAKAEAAAKEKARSKWWR